MTPTDLDRLQRLLRNASNAHVRLALQREGTVDPAARLAFESIQAARKIVDRAIASDQRALFAASPQHSGSAPRLFGGKRKLQNV
jgi:hypothetical protein